MPQQDDRSVPTAPPAVEEPVEELSADDDAWLGNEPSASLELSWIEDDLHSTPVDERTASPGAVPAEPEMKLTPPPASRKPIRRPAIERVRPRAELAASAKVLPRPTPPASRRAPIVLVAAAPSRRSIYLAYAGAIAAGVASGVAVLLLGS